MPLVISYRGKRVLLDFLLDFLLGQVFSQLSTSKYRQ